MKLRTHVAQSSCRIEVTLQPKTQKGSWKVKGKAKQVQASAMNAAADLN
jgi:hypothetical protein